MLVKWRIELQGDGLTISQSIDSELASPPVKEGAESLAVQNVLPGHFREAGAAAETAGARTGGDPVKKPRGPGGEGFETSGGAVTIIGPIILVCRPPQKDHGQ